MSRFAATLCCLFALAMTTTAGAWPVTISCDLVQGDLGITSITPTLITGDYSGDVVGSVEITVTNSYNLMTPWGPAKYIRGHGEITTADGTLSTNDNIIVFPYAGHRIWLGHHRITAGTGAFEDHFGRIKTYGEVAQGGTANLHYKGAICTASSP